MITVKEIAKLYGITPKQAGNIIGRNKLTFPGNLNAGKAKVALYNKEEVLDFFQKNEFKTRIIKPEPVYKESLVLRFFAILDENKTRFLLEN